MAMSEAQKQAIRESLKKYYETHSGPRTGIACADETKAKIRDRLKEYYATNPGPQTGKPMSDETKEKIRQAMLRRSQPQTKAKAKRS